MATNIQDVAPYDTIAHFDRIAALIQQTFNVLIEQLIKRRDTLCQEVAQLRDDFHSKESARVAAIEELEKTQKLMQQMNMKSNINLPVHEQAGLMYQEAKQKLCVPTPLPNLSFSCSTLSLLQSQIELFGEVVQLKVPKYSEKKQPILTAGKKGKGEKELNGSGLSLDEVNEKVYIADTFNQRVQVLSFQGEFLSHFGGEVLFRPWGISISDDYIFVIDGDIDTLFQFCKNSHQLLNKTDGEEGLLSIPKGLSVDWNGDVFVADRSHDRISVFSNLLRYKHTFGQGSLLDPQDVKLTTDKVVVLDWSPNCIHFFSRSGDLLTSCVPQGVGQECLAYRPYFFCLDGEQNIFVSDCYHHVIKILSSSGQLLHSIGRGGIGKGEFIKPFGIAISKSGILFVLSHNPNYILQLF